jgi:prepilin-type N-terminal cleavage/methylation domain-containing protein
MGSRNHSIHKSAKGFTLLEILVVMGLFLIVAGFGLFVSFDSLRGYSFREERDTIISALQKARSQSINNMCFGATCTDGKAHGVYFGIPHSYVIFQGVTYATRDVALDEVLTARNNVVAVSGATEVDFAPLVGTVVTTPITPMTVTVSDPTHSSVITFGTEGGMSWTH